MNEVKNKIQFAKNNGETTENKSNKSIYSLILDAVDKKSDATFFICNDHHIKYSDALVTIQKIANHLKKKGVGKEDRVIIYLDNCSGLIYSYFAVIQIGAVATMVNSACKYFEMRSYIEIIKPKLIITCLDKKINLISDDYEIFDQQNVIYIDGDDPENSFWAIVEKEDPCNNYEETSVSDVASIIFSSGMDGFSLGVMLGHHGIFNISKALAEMVDNDDVFMSILPLFHCYGLISSFLVPLQKKVPFKIIQGLPRESLDSLLKKDKISIFSTIPRIYELMIKKIQPDTTFPNMKRWISGGQSMSDKVIDDLINKFNIYIQQGYGLTEASSVVSWNHSKNQKNVRSVGQIMPWNKVKIINKSGNVLPNGQEGEILIKGSNVMLGYYNNPQKTQDVIIDGWLKTGDIGKLDDDGFLYITGRKKKMIIKNGINVYPKEVERMLWCHPQINSLTVESMERKNKYGSIKETLTATIYPKNSGSLNLRNLISWCTKNMSPYKIPDQIIIK